MLLNPCSYTLFSRNKEQFITRLTVNINKSDQKHVAKILGCWIDEDPGIVQVSIQQDVNVIKAEIWGRQHQRFDRDLHTIYSEQS